MNDPRRSEIQETRGRTAEIRLAVDALDLLASGTLRFRSKVCGRPTCRCANDPGARHGPYHEWQRYEDKRLVLRALSPEEAALLERAIENRRTLDRLIREWERISIHAILGSDQRKR